MDTDAMLAAALQYAAHGIPVIPLHRPTSRGCSCTAGINCKSPGKHPRHHHEDLPNGITNATTDPALIRKWWTRWPEANIGLATGRRSGITVIDVDGPAGQQTLEEHLSTSEISQTLAVGTGSGGFHLYYRTDEREIPNSVRNLPGIDTRGDGGYVVAPPSAHSSGTSYDWITETTFSELPPIPAALEQILIRNRPRLAEAEWGEILESGRRNQEIARRAGKLLYGDIPAAVVLRTLLDYNREMCDPPLPDYDIKKIVESISRRDREKRQLRQETAAAIRIIFEEDDPPPGANGDRPTSSAPPPLFSLLTFAEALHRYGGYETRWSIKGWLPQATVGLIVAPPGGYKTWLAADLCTAMCGIRGFLGSLPVEGPGPVIIVQQEDFLPMLLSRICMMLGAAGPSGDPDIMLPSLPEGIPIFLHDRRQLHFNNAASLRGLRQQIRAIRPKLVLIDPLYSAIDMQNYAADSAQKMLVLKDLRDEFGCSFMIAHHTAKSSNKEGGTGGRQRDEAWGSQFLNAWLETGWQLRQEESTPVIDVQRHFKVSQNPDPITLTFDIKEQAYAVHIGAKEPEDTESQKKQLLDLVAGGRVTSMRQAAQSMGLNGLGTVGRLFKELGLTKHGNYYALPVDLQLED